jgi:hypothetical protein
MGSLLEQHRGFTEKAASNADFETATGTGDVVRAMASLAYGQDDPRVLAMLSRAARSCLLQLPGLSLGKYDSLRRNLVAAGAACSAWVLKAGGLPDGELAFAAETRRAAILLAEMEGGLRLSEHVAGLPPARGVTECLWPTRSLAGFPEAGLPGDPVLPPGPGADELARRLEVIEAEEGRESPGWLEASSRLGDALAAEAFGLQLLAAGDSGRPAALVLEAEKLLGHAAGRLASVPGGSRLAAQDAQARLALFLTRDSGPVRLFCLPPGEVPRANLFAALEIWERLMEASPEGPDGALRRKDASLRAVDCLARLGFLDRARRLGFLDRARRLRDEVFGKRPRPFDFPDSPEPPGTVAAGSRDALAVYAAGELDMLAGNLESSDDAHEDAESWFQVSLGNSHRLSLRSTFRRAEVNEMRGRRVMASFERARAAEALEDLCRMPVTEGAGAGGREFPVSPELPALHVVRAFAAAIFTKAGNRAEAVAALSSQAEALTRLLGRRDPRTVCAEKFLAKARRLS